MRSPEVEQVIEDLKHERPECVVVPHDKDSSMIILVEDTEERLVFTADESKFLLGSRDAVKRLFEALDYPEEVFVELHGLVIDAEVMTELESLASTVDEM